MATYPPRRDSAVAVARLIAPQVDVLRIILNEFDAELPELTQIPNVRQIIPPSDMKDVGKFLPETLSASLVFLIDDDILYPSDYVQKSRERIAALGQPHAVYGYHASSYLLPKFAFKRRQLGQWWNWYTGRRDAVRRVMFFEKALDRATYVDQLGTGTMICPGPLMAPLSVMRDSQKFVDVRYALWCHQNQIAQIALPRPSAWLKAVRFEETIFSDFTQNAPRHVTAEIRQYACKRAQIGQPVA